MAKKTSAKSSKDSKTSSISTTSSTSAPIKSGKRQGKGGFIGCSIKSLPDHLQVVAAKTAIEHNPANAPAPHLMAAFATALVGTPSEDILTPSRLAFVTNRYWGNKGVDLTVSFLDSPTTGFINKWLAHANSWCTEAGANVKFRWVQSGGQVRVLRERGQGYWSYIGVDILHVPANEQTMNLDSFTESTPESEWTRVVRHEVGHSIGSPHEHLRVALVARLDVNKTLAYFRRTQGWDNSTIRANLLNPMNESALLGSSLTDEDSIMCYQIPGECTKDGRPIRGGANFSSTDKMWAAQTYPLAVSPPTPPPPPPPVSTDRTLIFKEDGTLILDGKVV